MSTVLYNSKQRKQEVEMMKNDNSMLSKRTKILIIELVAEVFIFTILLLKDFIRELLICIVIAVLMVVFVFLCIQPIEYIEQRSLSMRRSMIVVYS